MLGAQQETEFSDFVAGRWTALYRAAYLMVPDPARAEHVLQTALLAAYENWGRIRDLHAVEEYVRSAIVRTALGTLRKEAGGERPVAMTEEYVGRDLLSQVSLMPAQQRAAVMLRCYADLSVAATARELGITEGTVTAHTGSLTTEDVRRELDAALAMIDVPPAETRALLARAQVRRGPPRAAWILFAASVAIIGVMATLVVTGAGGPKVAAEAENVVPATSQALAALAIERLDLDPDVSAMGMFPGIDDADDVFGAIITTEPGAGRFLGSGLMLGIENEPEEHICTEFVDGCVTLASPRGDVILFWLADEGDPEAPDEADDPFLGLMTMYGVTWRDPVTDDFESVFVHGAAFDGDPRDSDLPFSIDDLVGLLTDERFGLMTSQELVDVELSGWMDVPDMGEFDMGEFDMDEFDDEFGWNHFDDEELAGLLERTEHPLAGDVAAMVETHLGMTPKKVEGFASGDGFAGADMRLPGKGRTELFLQVQSDAQFGALAMPCKVDPMLECATWDVPAGTVTLRWLGGEAPEGLSMLQVALEEADEWQMVSIMFFDGPEVSSDPRGLDLPVSVDQLVALLSDPGVALR